MSARRTLCLRCVSLLVMLLPSLPVPADDEAGEAGPPERIARWIVALDAEAFREREEATKALVAAGVDAIPAVARAVESESREVRTRALRVLVDLTRSDDPAIIALLEEHVAKLANSPRADIAAVAAGITAEIRNRRTAKAVARLTAGGLVVQQDDSGRYRNVSNNPAYGTRFFSATWNEIEDDLLAELVHLPDLWSVQLRDSGIGDAGLAHVAKVKGLTFLDIKGTNVTDDGLAVLADLPNLTYFSLASPHVTGQGLVHLRAAKGLSSLQFVGPTATDAWLAAVEPLRNVEFLELNGTNVTGEGLEAITKWSALNEAFLNNNAKVDDAGLAYFADKTKLTRVEMRLTAVTQSGVDEHLRGLPNVTQWGLPDGVEAPASESSD